MRLEITRKTDLAIRALVVLDQQAQKLKASMLATHISTTSGFLSQVMTPLVARGWVRSEPGPTGGYLLRVQTSTISVMDVIEAVEGKMDETRCVLFERACDSNNPCAMHGPWGRARAEMISELRSTTLDQLQLPQV
ncbi:MAG: RrF2 family transcriptional regulator [Roseiflexaceae bacterium]|jgi:Rrf2 family protein|nr:Rrf2 family transcriptional regulator [Chloroflexaceae bacterium]